jgi:flagellar motility protein MotE (MotC chaperone)
VKPKLILIAAAAGAISFIGSFATGWLTRPAAVTGAPASDTAVAGTPLAAGQPPHVLAPTATPPDEGASIRAMTEQQLKELISEVREKIQAYDDKLKALEKEEQRQQIAQQVLKKDIETLNHLRTDLASVAASVKSEKDMLLKTRVEIEQVEKANLTAIAAAYDKMDATSASDILTNMAIGSARSGGSVRSANMDDAVKILHFMQDRTKAKVLAEMVGKEPALAALLCQKLKQVQEGK